MKSYMFLIYLIFVLVGIIITCDIFTDCLDKEIIDLSMILLGVFSTILIISDKKVGKNNKYQESLMIAIVVSLLATCLGYSLPYMVGFITIIINDILMFLIGIAMISFVTTIYYVIKH